MKLWMGNIAPGTSDEELRELIGKYGGQAEVLSVQRVADDGPRPGAILDIAATTETMFRLTQRLNGMHWKGLSLTVQSMTR
jgi:hypothetical protein